MTTNAKTASFPRRLLAKLAGVTLGRLTRWVLLGGLAAAALAVGGFALYVWLPTHSTPALEPVDRYVYLDQGWGVTRDAAARQTYYYTSQGTSLPQGATSGALRYNWFVNLELPFSKRRFADPDHMRRYRFIVDPEPTASNPDQLPVGFARHFDPVLGQYLLDITCAACHSGEIHYRKGDVNFALRIDGGQAMHAFADLQRGSFAPSLLSSLIATRANPLKFERFAKNVLGTHYPRGKKVLRKELGETIDAFLASGQNNPLRHLYPVREGFGRTDALGRIANTVFGDHLVTANYHPAGAPVSYPYVWNIWKFDWVQYNGSVKQPLARNIGEALGVGARLRLTDPYGSPLPPEQRFTSSVSVGNLTTIEHTLQTLKPPQWPESILGEIDRDRAARGKLLFERHCRGCHGPHIASRPRQQANAPGKPGPQYEWLIEVIPVEHIGTDPEAANGFVTRRYDLSATGLSNDELRAVLRPLQIRALARDALFRLTEVVSARERADLDLGTLGELLAAYPDPNAHRKPAIARESFAAIATELARLLNPPPSLPERGTPPEPYNCDLQCQQLWLLWDVTRGEQHIAQQLEAVDVSRLSEGAGLNILGLLIKEKFYRDANVSYAEQQCLEGFGTLDLPQVIAGYKPRPLEGVWATPPFLHNGSVPNLYQMLLPPEQRDRRFFVGRRQFDPQHVGYVTVPVEGAAKDGFWLDTSIDGNRNSGHAFSADEQMWEARRTTPLPPGVIGPEFSDEQRWEIVEYLKIHRDTEGSEAPVPAARCGRWAK